MKIQLVPHKIYTLLAVILLINLLLLGGTWLFHYHFYEVLGGNWEESSVLSLVLVEFSLANENVLATWYSSMLFLLVGLMSLLCFLVRKKVGEATGERYLSLGWLLFFLLFAALSLDEMASLHERLGNVAALNPLGDYPLGWVSLLGIPIALVSCLMVWFSLMQIKRAPLAVVFAVVGILLFMSIPLQERIEVDAWHAAADRATWKRPVDFLLLEEGTELFAATFMLVATFTFLIYALNTTKKLSLSPPPGLELKLNRKRSLLLICLGCGLLALLLLLLIKSPFPALEGDPGIMRNWFPSALAFLSFLCAFHLFSREWSQKGTFVNPYLSVALFSLFLSSYYGGNIYGYFRNYAGDLWEMIFISILLVWTLSIGWNLFKRSRQTFSRLGAALCTLFVLLALTMSNTSAVVLAFLAFSILLLVLVNHYFEQIAVLRSPVKEGPGQEELRISSSPTRSAVYSSEGKRPLKTERTTFTSPKANRKKS